FFWLRVFWAIKVSNKTGIKNTKRTRRPSISYNPPRSPQSAFIHSTRIPCSQRSRGWRVPEYHSILWTEGDHFDLDEPRAHRTRWPRQRKRGVLERSHDGPFDLQLVRRCAPSNR